MTANADHGTGRHEHAAPHSEDCCSIRCPCYLAGVLAGSFGVTLDALAKHLPPNDGSPS